MNATVEWPSRSLTGEAAAWIRLARLGRIDEMTPEVEQLVKEMDELELVSTPKRRAPKVV